MEASVICFGEVLWDVFPSGEKIGGAPLNVALRLNTFGVKTKIASRVGEDALGKRLLDFVVAENLSRDLIQVDPAHETGQVLVHLDENGSASYTIAHPAAWDKIEALTSLVDHVKISDAFLFGSLVARDAVAKATLDQLLNHANYKVFDVNLRAPHYSIPLLVALMNKADFIKFNDDELIEISQALGCKEEAMEQQIRFIAEQTQTNTICVTRGSEGALLYQDEKFISQPGFPIKVKDTVGAGDSFLATLLEGLLNKKPAEEALKRACAMGAMVAGSTGANPRISEAELATFIQQHAS